MRPIPASDDRPPGQWADTRKRENSEADSDFVPMASSAYSSSQVTSFLFFPISTANPSHPSFPLLPPLPHCTVEMARLEIFRLLIIILPPSCGCCLRCLHCRRWGVRHRAVVFCTPAYFPPNCLNHTLFVTMPIVV
ncbi:hypothetical protein SprV_0301199800 [Sparganum proliferum]